MGGLGFVLENQMLGSPWFWGYKNVVLGFVLKTKVQLKSMDWFWGHEKWFESSGLEE